MKLTKFHLFLIVLSVLVASTLGFSIKEYFDSKIPTNKLDNKGDKDTLNKDKKGKKYDPFSSKDTNYECLIADLEDNVNPHRRERRRKFDNENDIERIDRLRKKCKAKKRRKQEKEEEKEEEREREQKEFDNPEDKWILKSKIVPPVCPKCPDSRVCPRQKKCPPCKPCGRCPEPSSNKKVSNYNPPNASSLNNNQQSSQQLSQQQSQQYIGDGSYDSNGNLNSIQGGTVRQNLPMPRLNSFAQFN